MSILRKIVEFRKEKLNDRTINITYRVSNCDLLELSKVAAKQNEGFKTPDFTLIGAIDFYEREKDLILIKHWFKDNNLMIFGVYIVLDKPLYNKTFNY